LIIEVTEITADLSLRQCDKPLRFRHRTLRPRSIIRFKYIAAFPAFFR